MTYLTSHWPIRAGGRSWLLAAAVAALALAGLAVLDAQISQFGRSLSPPLITLFGWITRLGESDWILVPALVVLVIAGLAALAVRRYTPRRALLQLTRVAGFVFLTVSFTGLITNIIKRLVGRGRPEITDVPFDFQTLGWVDWSYQSFPSGHSTTAFCLCFTFAFLIPRAFPVLLLLAVLVGVSRIVLGAHFPTDVLAGALIGTLGTYLVRNLFALRRWVFQYAPDGTVVVRPPAAIRRLVTRRRGLSPRRP